MDNYEQTFDTWNKMADLYQEKFMDLAIYNESYDRFCEMAPVNGRILEIGCGPGNIARYLLQKQPAFQLKGLDVAENMVKLARKNNPSAEFEVMDIRFLHELQEHYDGILCGFCIPYISVEECNKLFKDCAQMLSTNGVLYVSFVEGTDEQSGLKTNNTGDSVYFYYHDLDVIKKSLNNNQFTIKDVMHVNYPKPGDQDDVHTIVIAKKISTEK